MKTIVIQLLAGIGLLAGCVSPQARRGRVVEADIGSPFPNFTFQDERGETQDLRENLGDFTVLVFSECGKDMHGAVSTSLVDLVEANQEPGYVETVGFDIHWSKDGCPHHTDCHLLEGGPRVFSICDARAPKFAICTGSNPMTRSSSSVRIGGSSIEHRGRTSKRSPPA